MRAAGSNTRNTTVAATRKPERPHEREHQVALADQLGQTPRRNTGTPCSVGALEDYLTGAEADAFEAMLHTLGWSGRRIWDTVQAEAKALREEAGLDALAGDTIAAAQRIGRAAIYAAMSEQQVNRHRSRGCRCFR